MRLNEIDASKTYGGMELEVLIDFDKHLIKEHEDKEDEIISTVETVPCILTAPRAINIVAAQNCLTELDNDVDVDLENLLKTGLSWIRFKNNNNNVNKKNLRMGECSDFINLITEFIKKATPSKDVPKEG